MRWFLLVALFVILGCAPIEPIIDPTMMPNWKDDYGYWLSIDLEVNNTSIAFGDTLAMDLEVENKSEVLKKITLPSTCDVNTGFLIRDRWGNRVVGTSGFCKMIPGAISIAPGDPLKVEYNCVCHTLSWSQTAPLLELIRSGAKANCPSAGPAASFTTVASLGVWHCGPSKPCQKIG